MQERSYTFSDEKKIVLERERNKDRGRKSEEMSASDLFLNYLWEIWTGNPILAVKT